MSSGTGANGVEQEQLQPAADNADTAASSARTSTGPALAVKLPQVAAAACEKEHNESAAPDEAPCSSRPASPLNIHSLLNRPFGDVMREIASGFQMRSTAQVAAEQLRYLVFHRDHDGEVLANPALMGHLMQQVRESPGLPSAGSCMFVLAQLARTPPGRAQVRAEGGITPVLRFLSLPDVLSKSNAEAALLLLQNISCDKHSRHTFLKAGAVEKLLRLLSANPMTLKQQQPRVAAHITGALVNLICGENESSAAKHIFAKAGGLEICCKVLATWGRHDHSAATLRLRLLLADIGKLQQYAVQLHQTALDASTSARNNGPAVTSSSGQITSARGPGSAAGARFAGPGLGQLVVPDVEPEVLAMAGKGIPLGTPRMPASERITAVVLKHGRDNHDKEEGSDEEGEG